MSSCGEDFLYKTPQGSVDEEALLTTQGIELLVTNAYATLTEDDFGASPFNWVHGGIYGGDANKGSDEGDQPPVNQFETYSVLTTNNYLDEKWRWTYKGVARVNKTLQTMAKVEGLDEATKTKRTGELLFLRAMFYFESVKSFTSYIPWVDETFTENNPKVHNDKDIYPNILDDLTKASQSLPESQDEPGRINKWAAEGLRAKVLMQMGNLSEAKVVLKNLLENGVTATGLPYALADNLQDNWACDMDNKSPESIFEIQFSVDVENNSNSAMMLCYPYSDGPGGCCGFYQPSFELANSFKVDENGLPMLDAGYRNGKSVSEFNTGEGLAGVTDVTIAVDPRLDFTMGRFEIPYKDWGLATNGWIRKTTNGGLFTPKKHVYSKAESDAGLGSPSRNGWAPGSAMNIQYLSVRDAILLYAECLANDGDLKGAMEQVNKIRERAANPVNITRKLIPGTTTQDPNGEPAANYKISQYPSTHAAFTDKETCIKAIRMERKLELAMEGQRFFDLARWGGNYMSQEIADFLTFESKYLVKYRNKKTLDAAKTMLPIPDTQIQTMGNDENGQPYLVQPEPWK